VQNLQTTYFIVVSWVEIAMVSVLVAAFGVAITLWVQRRRARGSPRS
jgi:hypothetical protein